MRSKRKPLKYHAICEVLLVFGGVRYKKQWINLNTNSIMQMFVSSAYFNFMKRQTESNGTEIVLYHIL